MEVGVHLEVLEVHLGVSKVEFVPSELLFPEGGAEYYSNILYSIPDSSVLVEESFEHKRTSIRYERWLGTCLVGSLTSSVGATDS